MKFLLVEDDVIDAAALERLVPIGVDLTQVRTLEEAIRAADEDSFNLILLDLGLPDSSGIDTFVSLQEHVQATPIVVLTGVDNEELAVRVIKAGAQDYLVKGYLDQRALRSLGFAVERDRLAKELQDERDGKAQLAKQLREQDTHIAHMGRVALMGEVVGEIAHEVGQPLQALANTVGVLDKIVGDGTATPDDLKKHLKAVNGLLVQTQSILRRLRGFVKDSPPELVSLDMNEVVQATLQLLEFEGQSLQIRITPHLWGGRLGVVADRVQVQQVIVNLLRNAFEAIGDLGSDRRHITIRTMLEGSRVVVEVEDSGKGLELSPEEMFAPFRTTKDEGLGMGLAICSKIVDDHNGMISASAGQQTTVFRFDLPEQP
jgi:C4-dicarboxylate-specific signal transduction histidine kinase